MSNHQDWDQSGIKITKSVLKAHKTEVQKQRGRKACKSKNTRK